MAKDMMKIMIRIEDEAGWLSVIDSSEDKLVIIDIHQDWCGPTEAIHPTLSRVFQDYDDADERITIASVSIQKLGAALIQASFPSECHINLDKNGCIPIFALYRFKSCSTVIGGVDAPALLQQIALNIPDKAKVGTEQ